MSTLDFNICEESRCGRGVQYTPALQRDIVHEATKFHPLEGILLVGSTVWLGLGEDIDAVVLVKDMEYRPDGYELCAGDSYAGQQQFAAYRKDTFNVIVVTCPMVWAGWVHASRQMQQHERQELEDKEQRVALCVAYREAGEKIWRITDAKAASQ